jgi:hypothetical protein
MCEGLGKCMVTEACNSYSINGTKSTGLVVAPNPTAKHFADGKQISALINFLFINDKLVQEDWLTSCQYKWYSK